MEKQHCKVPEGTPHAAIIGQMRKDEEARWQKQGPKPLGIEEYPPHEEDPNHPHDPENLDEITIDMS